MEAESCFRVGSLPTSWCQPLAVYELISGAVLPAQPTLAHSAGWEIFGVHGNVDDNRFGRQMAILRKEN